MLETPSIIAIVTLLGGVVLLLVDKWFMRPKVDDVDDVTPKKSLMIGLFQVLALFCPD